MLRKKGCAAPERLHTPLRVKEKSECGNIGRGDGLAGQGAAVGVLRQSQLALAQQLDGLLVVSSVPVVAHELPVVVHVRLDGAALDSYKSVAAPVPMAIRLICISVFPNTYTPSS